MDKAKPEFRVTQPTQPRFICIFNAKDRIHQIIPVDFILAISPLFELSSEIASPQPVIGKTLITMKDRQGFMTDHSMADLIDLLGADMIPDRPLTIYPEGRPIVIPEAEIIDINKGKPDAKG